MRLRSLVFFNTFTLRILVFAIFLSPVILVAVDREGALAEPKSPAKKTRRPNENNYPETQGRSPKRPAISSDSSPSERAEFAEALFGPIDSLMQLSEQDKRALVEAWKIFNEKHQNEKRQEELARAKRDLDHSASDASLTALFSEEPQAVGSCSSQDIRYRKRVKDRSLTMAQTYEAGLAPARRAAVDEDESSFGQATVPDVPASADKTIAPGANTDSGIDPALAHLYEELTKGAHVSGLLPQPTKRAEQILPQAAAAPDAPLFPVAAVTDARRVVGATITPAHSYEGHEEVRSAEQSFSQQPEAAPMTVEAAPVTVEAAPVTVEAAPVTAEAEGPVLPQATVPDVPAGADKATALDATPQEETTAYDQSSLALGFLLNAHAPLPISNDWKKETLSLHWNSTDKIGDSIHNKILTTVIKYITNNSIDFLEGLQRYFSEHDHLPPLITTTPPNLLLQKAQQEMIKNLFVSEKRNFPKKLTVFEKALVKGFRVISISVKDEVRLQWYESDKKDFGVYARLMFNVSESDRRESVKRLRSAQDEHELHLRDLERTGHPCDFAKRNIFIYQYTFLALEAQRFAGFEINFEEAFEVASRSLSFIGKMFNFKRNAERLVLFNQYKSSFIKNLKKYLTEKQKSSEKNVALKIQEFFDEISSALKELTTLRQVGANIMNESDSREGIVYCEVPETLAQAWIDAVNCIMIFGVNDFFGSFWPKRPEYKTTWPKYPEDKATTFLAMP